MKDIPQKIYLVLGSQPSDDFKDHSQVTWCQEQIYKTDPEYLHKDLVDQQNAKLREALEQIVNMQKQAREENYNYAFNRCWHIADKALRGKE